MIGDAFNPAMAVIARESRGLTQGELSSRIGVTQGKISKIELGLLSPSDLDIEKIASTLDYPAQFFFQSDDAKGFATGCIYYRKRKSVPVAQVKKLQASLNILRMQVAKLLTSVDIQSTCDLYRMDIDEFDGSAERIAQLLRNSWHITSGPVVNLVRIIELSGGIVFRCSFGTEKIDAVSQWVPGIPPLFFVNADAPGDRARWSLAHELGHVIMHGHPTGDQESEADRFAAEFLMPELEIASQLSPVTIQRMAALKDYWKVSMAALIKRAFDLEKIGEGYYRKLFMRLNQLGYRKREPIMIQHEEPTVLRDLVAAHLGTLGYSIQELSGLLCLHEHEFRSLYLPTADGQMRLKLVQ